MSPDSPDLVIAKRLLDHLKLRGFRFQRTAPGVDAPLVGHRVSDDWIDTIQIEGFSRDCLARRQRASSLIVPGGGLVEHQVAGSALTVLNEMLTWEMGTPIGEDDIMGKDDKDKEDEGKHRDEDNTADAQRDRPVPDRADPNKHDR